MVTKILLLNLPASDIPKDLRQIDFNLTTATFKHCPTIHDFHVLIIDTSEVLKGEYWDKERNAVYLSGMNYTDLLSYKNRIEEQIKTGGITFCFASKTLKISTAYGLDIGNYFFCPGDLEVKSEEGDTFYPKVEEFGYFKPFLKLILGKEVNWGCYFSKLPPSTKVLGTNRAGYPVFVEIGIGAGKLVMLPRFSDRSKAISIIVDEIVPQMIQEEQVEFRPQWVADFSSGYEEQTKKTLREIGVAKKLLYAKDKALKKAVAFAFEKLGFVVEILPDGTLPDLRISNGEQKAAVEVKGHENRQVDRKDTLQLLGYMSEEDVNERGIVVANHEFNTKPDERSKKAFTEGAIQLANSSEISLVSAADLYEMIMGVLQEELGKAEIQEKRRLIMTSIGLANLSREISNSTVSTD